MFFKNAQKGEKLKKSKFSTLHSHIFHVAIRVSMCSTIYHLIVTWLIGSARAPPNITTFSTWQLLQHVLHLI